MVFCGVVACLSSLSIGYVIGAPNIPESAIRGLGGDCGPYAPYTTQRGFPNCFLFSDLLWVGSILPILRAQMVEMGVKGVLLRIKSLKETDTEQISISHSVWLVFKRAHDIFPFEIQKEQTLSP
jgi:hypothetical protein